MYRLLGGLLFLCRLLLGGVEIIFDYRILHLRACIFRYRSLGTLLVNGLRHSYVRQVTVPRRNGIDRRGSGDRHCSIARCEGINNHSIDLGRRSEGSIGKLGHHRANCRGLLF